MNAPFIWIILPGAIGVILFFLLRFRRMVSLAGLVTSLLLVLAVYVLPLGKPIVVGRWSIEISEAWVILGRTFILESHKHSMVVLLYLTIAFWFGGTSIGDIDRRIVPMGLGIASLLSAALFVQPFLYAAIFIEMAVLICAALLVSPSQAVPPGVLRFLTFQTLGLPFILMAGWMLSGIEANPGDAALVRQVGVLVALGFGLLMAIFPFHSWIPMLAEEANPYITAFVYFALTLAISLFVINFLDRYNWLYASPWLLVFLRLSGVLMVALGGIAGAFQKHLGRLMGFSMLVEIGNSLLAMSLGSGGLENRDNFRILFASFLPRGLSLGMLGLALVIIRSQAGSLEYNRIRGLARNYWLSTASIFIGLLSLAGFPLTAGFPIRLILWQELSQQFPLAAYAAIIGSSGILIGSLRAVGVLVLGSDQQPWRTLETAGQKSLLFASLLITIVIGLYPQGIYPILYRMALIFLRLEP